MKPRVLVEGKFHPVRADAEMYRAVLVLKPDGDLGVVIESGTFNATGDFYWSQMTVSASRVDLLEAAIVEMDRRALAADAARKEPTPCAKNAEIAVLRARISELEKENGLLRARLGVAGGAPNVVDARAEAYFSGRAGPRVEP